MTYHINPETNKSSTCRAQTKESCRFAQNGVAPEHYDTKQEADEAIAKLAADSYETLPKLSKKNSFFSEMPLSTFKNHLKYELKNGRAVIEKKESRDAGITELNLKEEEICSPEEFQQIFEKINAKQKLYRKGSLKIDRTGYGDVIGEFVAKNGRKTSFIISITNGSGYFGDDNDYHEKMLRKGDVLKHGLHISFDEDEVKSFENWNGFIENKFIETVAKYNDKETIGWNRDRDSIVNSYLGSDYAPITRAMRSGKLDPVLKESLVKFASEDELKEETIVFRGMSMMSKGELEDFKKGETFNNTLISTSTSPSEALSFSKNNPGSIIMKFKLPKGTYCKEIMGHECEIILPPNTKFEEAEILVLDETIELNSLRDIEYTRDESGQVIW